MSHRAFSVLFIVLLAWGVYASFEPSTDPIDANLAKATRLGAEWFLNNQDDKFLHYEYDAKDQMYVDKTHRLRETGALWSIASYASCTRDPDFIALTHKGLSFFEDDLVYDENADIIILNSTPRSLKLGYSAFMILSFLESDHQHGSYYMEKLANGILSLQRPDGSFYTYFDRTEVQSENFYPGEALVSLMALYEKNGDPRLLESVGAAFPYYLALWQKDPTTSFAPWQTRAYVKFHRAKPRADVAEFVFSMGDFILNNYEPQGRCAGFDLHGGALPVHLEGVIQAYELAQEVGDSQRVECYANFVREGVDFILSMQIKDYSQGSPGYGAFRTGEATFRVDRNQHAIMALMDACNTNLFDCGLC